MAAAYAVLNFLGEAGYLEIARRKIEATRRLVKGITDHPDLNLMAPPDFCMFSFTSDTISVFHLIDEMNSKGWYIQPALSYGPSRRNIHLSINNSNVEWVEAFLSDLYEAVEAVRSASTDAISAPLKKEFAEKDIDGMSDQEIADLLTLANIGGGEFPQQYAEINAMLDAVPARLRERLLIEYTNQIF